MPPRKGPRPVQPGERAKPLSLTEAAKRGDRLAELRAMRLILADRVADSSTPPRDLAALSRRQIEVGREIEELEAKQQAEAESDSTVKRSGSRGRSAGGSSDAKFKPEAI